VELISDIAPNSDFSLLWSNGQTTQTATFDTTGDYTVILTDQNNCTVSSLPFNIVSNIPVVPVITASGDTAFCDGLNVVLTSTPANSYNWSVGGNTNTVTVSTTQTVTVTTIDANGCEATSSPRVITNVPNIIPVISPAGPITICEGQSVTLTSNVAVGNLWNKPSTRIPFSYYTNNGGQSWTASAIFPVPGNWRAQRRLNAVSCDEQGKICNAVGFVRQRNVNSVSYGYLSMDGGISWSTSIFQSHKPFTNLLNSVALLEDESDD
jgi:hypothetical protein